MAIVHRYSSRTPRSPTGPSTQPPKGVRLGSPTGPFAIVPPPPNSPSLAVPPGGVARGRRPPPHPCRSNKPLGKNLGVDWYCDCNIFNELKRQHVANKKVRIRNMVRVTFCSCLTGTGPSILTVYKLYMHVNSPSRTRLWALIRTPSFVF